MRLIKKIAVVGVWLSFLSLSSNPSWADRVGGSGRPGCESGQGGSGGEVPNPFSNVNQKVELADGESYLLVGRVIIDSSDRDLVYLAVDLKEHPWLANAKRKADPFYLIEASGRTWRKYDGLRVKITAEAKMYVVGSEKRGFHTLMSLLPTKEPVEAPLGYGAGG